jgi:hypothetical protein
MKKPHRSEVRSLPFDNGVVAAVTYVLSGTVKQVYQKQTLHCQVISPKHCESASLQVGSPSEKTDLLAHSLKRSPEKDKQRKWWCKVPVWHKRYCGLIRANTGKLNLMSLALVPPNALFGLWKKTLFQKNLFEKNCDRRVMC